MKHLPVFLAIVILFSCKKHDPPPPPPPACLISQVTHSGGFIPTTPTKFIYDEKGRLIRTEEGPDITTFTYTHDSVIANMTKSTGQFTGRTVVINNRDGLALNIYAIMDPQGEIWSNTTFEYNGQQLARSTFTNFITPAPLVTTFTWSGGNMVSATTVTATGTSTDHYEYYTDQPRQQGDYQNFQQFSQGFEIFRSKNLVKSELGLKLTYEFRQDGRISSVNAIDTASNSFIYKYDYSCK